MTWSAFCRCTFWLLSVYMDHGDTQNKNAFILIDYFTELYKTGIDKHTPKKWGITQKNSCRSTGNL